MLPVHSRFCLSLTRAFCTHLFQSTNACLLRAFCLFHHRLTHDTATATFIFSHHGRLRDNIHVWNSFRMDSFFFIFVPRHLFWDGQAPFWTTHCAAWRRGTPHSTAAGSIPYPPRALLLPPRLSLLPNIFVRDWTDIRAARKRVRFALSFQGRGRSSALCGARWHANVLVVPCISQRKTLSARSKRWFRCWFFHFQQREQLSPNKIARASVRAAWFFSMRFGSSGGFSIAADGTSLLSPTYHLSPLPRSILASLTLKHLHFFSLFLSSLIPDPSPPHSPSLLSLSSQDYIHGSLVSSFSTLKKKTIFDTFAFYFYFYFWSLCDSV